MGMAAFVVLLVVVWGGGFLWFKGGLKPVRIWISEEYTRAAQGGTGAAKCAGNYAASLVAQQEASANGCDQVVFLDAVEKRLRLEPPEEDLLSDLGHLWRAENSCANTRSWSSAVALLVKVMARISSGLATSPWASSLR